MNTDEHDDATSGDAEPAGGGGGEPDGGAAGGEGGAVDREDHLSDVCADLLEKKRHEPAVLALVSAPRGTWSALGALLDGAGVRLPGPREHLDGVHVTWLDAPNLGPSYVMIVFVQDVLAWSLVAQYNRARLLRAHGIDG